jgi:hypothetical protein
MYVIIAKVLQLRRISQDVRRSCCLGVKQLPGQVCREPEHRSVKHCTLIRYKDLALDDILYNYYLL